MRLLVFWVLLISVVFSYGQIEEDFTDGDFVLNPSWSGDSDRFVIGSDLRLWLNAPAVTSMAGMSVASLASVMAEWQFNIRMEFNPSSSNYCKIYLISDKQNLTNSLNGYYLRLGFTNDDISLIRQTGTTETVIIDGLNGLLNKSLINVSIKATRDSGGLWRIQADTTDGIHYFDIGTCSDNFVRYCSYSGVVCIYTSTRSKQFSFDRIRISGMPYIDSIRPVCDSVKMYDRHSLLLFFSEPLDSLSSHCVANYSINGLTQPSTVLYFGSRQCLILQFNEPFNEGRLSLKMNNISDDAGNIIRLTEMVFNYFSASFQDIVFTEIMADPTPVVRLPGYEYLELFNRSDKYLSISKWKLKIGNTIRIISDITVIPGEYLIFCNTAAEAYFSLYGRVVPVFSSASSLSNDGQTIQLFDSNGVLITELYYTPDWHSNSVKKDGGWSLEIIDPENPCTGSRNWTSSVDPSGGTPGRENSVNRPNPDLIPPAMEKIIVLTDSTVIVVFNEMLDSIEVSQPVYFVDQQIGAPRIIRYIGEEHTRVLLVFNQKLITGKVYTMKLTGKLTDCYGNYVDQNQLVSFALPELAAVGDIIINEVLFNPFSGGYDYVELYNRSLKVIDIASLRIGNGNAGAGSSSVLSEDGRLIFPGEFLVFSESSQSVQMNYYTPDPESIIELREIPSFPDDDGMVSLYTSDLTVIDQMVYRESMHFALINNTEGVSLEKIHYDIPANDTSGWHSAAATVGYGTPGYENSQFAEGNAVTDGILLSPEAFSPDNDGIDDFLTINYNFSLHGNLATVRIYDRNGICRKTLLDNELIGAEGVLFWDGTTEEGYRDRQGIYIVWFSIIRPDGYTRSYKKPCVLSVQNR